MPPSNKVPAANSVCVALGEQAGTVLVAPVQPNVSLAKENKEEDKAKNKDDTSSHSDFSPIVSLGKVAADGDSSSKRDTQKGILLADGGSFDKKAEKKEDKVEDSK